MKMPKIGVERLVDDAILANQEPPRKRLGCSQIGDECETKIWFELNHQKPIDDARVLRIFSHGHTMEDHIIKILRDSGLTIYNEFEGKQFRVSFIDGGLTGSVDGVILGLPESDEPHLLEIKTYNDTRFKKLSTEGVQKSDPKYYVQMCLYMEGLELERALFVAYNKNTSEMYFERVYADKFEVSIAVNKASKILAAKDKEGIDRISEKCTDYRCKFCKYSKECFDVCSKTDKK
jgi:hypothetical protein